jgi:hypothetical protein
MLTKTNLQQLYSTLPPISKRKPYLLIDLAARLKALEEEKPQTSAAATDVWHQLILLCQAQLKELQPQQLTAASLCNQDYVKTYVEAGSGKFIQLQKQRQSRLPTH